MYLDYLTRPDHGSRKEGTMGAEEQTTVVDVDLVELDEGVDQEERERRRNKAYTVVVRTPAGFEARFRVHPNERGGDAGAAGRAVLRPAE